MKKQNGKDTKKAAANDKVEERYSLGSITTVKRGFLLEFVKFVENKRNGRCGDAGEGVQRTADRRPQGRRRSGRSLHPLLRQQRTVQGREMSGPDNPYFAICHSSLRALIVSRNA